MTMCLTLNDPQVTIISEILTQMWSTVLMYCPTLSQKQDKMVPMSCKQPARLHAAVDCTDKVVIQTWLMDRNLFCRNYFF